MTITITKAGAIFVIIKQQNEAAAEQEAQEMATITEFEQLTN